MQQGYPMQYPMQQQGYPMQQQGYPMQQQGYPMQQQSDSEQGMSTLTKLAIGFVILLIIGGVIYLLMDSDEVDVPKPTPIPTPPVPLIKPALTSTTVSTMPVPSDIPSSNTTNPTTTTVTVPTTTTPTEWMCIPDINVPLRREASGDISCMSIDEKNCLWAIPGKCNERLTEYSAKPPYVLKPLVCGDMHKQVHKDTGYTNPDHWCAKANKSPLLSKK